MIKRFLPFLLVLALAACAPLGPSQPTQPPTLLPQPTPGNTGVPTATMPPTPQPTPSTTGITTPSTTVVPTSRTDAAATFGNCTMLPALPDCGNKLPLTGRLAFYDSKGQRLVVADFTSGTAWQVPVIAAPSGLSFSPSSKLLASKPPDNSALPYVIYNSANGAQVDQAAPQGIDDWTPQNSFEGTPFRTVYSAAGDAAWIDSNTALAHIRFAASPDKDVTFPISSGPTPQNAAGPSDRIGQAVAWVPGSDLLLFEQHYAANSMWTDGGALSAINVKTGEIKDMQAAILLGYQLQWNPKQPGVMVFGESGKSPVMGGQQLAVLNVLTGELAHPIADQNVSISAPVWLPDGKGILFAASMPGQTPAADAPFALPAIYAMNQDGSSLRRLTDPQQNTRDDQAQLLADGQHFIYYRRDTQNGTFSVRLAPLNAAGQAALDGGAEQAVTGSLTVPQCTVTCAWDTAVVYQP